MTGAVLRGELLPAAGVGLVDVAERLTGDDVGALVTRWLLARTDSDDSERAYKYVVGELWLPYLARLGVEPLAAQRSHVDLWVRMVQDTPTVRTGRPPRPATVAQRVAVVASWYDWLADEGVIEASPVRRRGRPKAPTESTTVGLSAQEVADVRRRCREHESPLDRATIELLLECGFRVGELCALDVGDVQPEEGETVAQVREGKGRKARRVPLGPNALDALTVYVEQRAARAGVAPDELPADAPLLATVAGGRLVPRTVTRLVQRVARAAGVTSWSRLSPHSLRHTCATRMLDAGVGIDVVQDILGHASTSTTRRYDRARGSVRRMAAAVRRLDEHVRAAA
jgi:site-specific recombinase XerD